jgi:hypothetical protein
MGILEIADEEKPPEGGPLKSDAANYFKPPASRRCDADTP